MAYRTVMGVDMDCYKCKKVALQSVTKIDGIDKISINMKDKTITVDGDADPVCIANEIRRKFKCARLISTGPPPPPPPPPAPAPAPAPKPKKEKDKKDDGKHQIIICPKYPPCMGYCLCAPPQHSGCCTCSTKSGIVWPGCHPPMPPANEVWYILNEENQSSCTIC